MAFIGNYGDIIFHKSLIAYLVYNFDGVGVADISDVSITSEDIV